MSNTTGLQQLQGVSKHLEYNSKKFCSIGCRLKTKQIGHGVESCLAPVR